MTMKTVLKSMRCGNTNSHIVTLGKLELCFSYETVVAFSDASETIASENLWGQTTGKHINAFAGCDAKRIGRAEFERKLQEALKRNGVFLNGIPNAIAAGDH